jgi:hypothetical protein
MMPEDNPNVHKLEVYAQWRSPSFKKDRGHISMKMKSNKLTTISRSKNNKFEPEQIVDDKNRCQAMTDLVSMMGEMSSHWDFCKITIVYTLNVAKEIVEIVNDLEEHMRSFTNAVHIEKVVIGQGNTLISCDSAPNPSRPL